jgi:hypothetical protein
MENTPTAPAEATKAPESVETPTNTSPAPAQAPDMHGFTSEQLADMKKFFDNNGGFDGVKAKISNPEKPVEKPVENSQPQKTEEPTSHTQEPTQTQAPQTPQGAITAQEFLAKQYFKSLAGEEKYAPIAKGIENGDYLKEMAAFGINALNQDGSINDQKVRMYLDLKAQTMPAKPTETEPNASAAPTVSYTEVGEAGFTNIDQAYKVLMEPGNPNMAKAEEFIRNHFNSNAGKK